VTHTEALLVMVVVHMAEVVPVLMEVVEVEINMVTINMVETLLVMVEDLMVEIAPVLMEAIGMEKIDMLTANRIKGLLNLEVFPMTMITAVVASPLQLENLLHPLVVTAALVELLTTEEMMVMT